MWQLAQDVRRTVWRTDTLGAPNQLTGLLYCANCGARMYNHHGIRWRSTNVKSEKVCYKRDHYDCSTFCNSHIHLEASCCQHYIRTDAVRELILAAIRSVSTCAVENEAAFIEQMRSVSELRQAESVKALKQRIKREQKRAVLKQADSIIFVNRTDKKNGTLARDRFLVSYASVVLAVYNGERHGGDRALRAQAGAGTDCN